MSDKQPSGQVIVVGAGLMGTGIAHGFAASGFEILLVDVEASALARAGAAIKAVFDGGVELGKITPEQRDAGLARLTTGPEIPASSDAELLIETASENLEIKLDIIRRADAALPPTAVIATNTSALSVTEIAAASPRPERLVGMHFFNPVHKMKLVEIVRGLATDDATLERARGYVERLGKTGIIVADAPGLTTSRMSALMGNEAMWMLLEGTASAEDIDTAMRLGFNHPMGPLELGDLTGWDTRLSVLRYLHGVLGDKFRPCPLIIKMVKAGRTGRKAGHGVYAYQDGQRVPGSGLKPGAL